MPESESGVSSTPHPQTPGSVLLGSLGHRSIWLLRHEGRPVARSIVSETPHPQMPGNVLLGSSGQKSADWARHNGNRLIVDVHIKVDGNLTVVQAHRIATAVEESLKKCFGASTISNVHIEPYTGNQLK